MMKVLCRRILFVSFGGMVSWCHALSLGVVGETFPVAEKSMLTLIDLRLNELMQTGEFEKMEHAFIDEVQRHVNRPTALGLTRIEKTRVHRYTPVVFITHDIVDANNHVVIARGSRLNALETLAYYDPHWVFINGDDIAQVRFATHQLQLYSDLKLILTGGSVAQMEAVFNREIFFDQGGRITRQLGISHVPAMVFRAQHALSIHEVAIREDGHER